MATFSCDLCQLWELCSLAGEALCAALLCSHRRKAVSAVCLNGPPLC